MNIKTKNIIETTKFIINEYSDLLRTSEIKTIKYIITNFDKLSLNNIETLLLPIIKNIWDIELESGKYIVVSWNKYPYKKQKEIVTFATLCEKDNIVSFCNLTSGIQYKIDFNSILGACCKDGVTLIEDKSRIGNYTIGIIGDKVINSYNGATKFITPKQLVQTYNNEYKSKHNELVLESKYIEEIGTYEINRDCFGEHKKI